MTFFIIILLPQLTLELFCLPGCLNTSSEALEICSYSCGLLPGLSTALRRTNSSSVTWWSNITGFFKQVYANMIKNVRQKTVFVHLKHVGFRFLYFSSHGKSFSVYFKCFGGYACFDRHVPYAFVEFHVSGEDAHKHYINSL